MLKWKKIVNNKIEKQRANAAEQQKIPRVEKNEIEELQESRNKKEAEEILNLCINENFYKGTREYLELKVAINLFPSCFSECKENLNEKLEKFLNETHKEYVKVIKEMFKIGYKEAKDLDEKIDSYISRIS